MRSDLNPGSEGAPSLFMQFHDFWVEVESLKIAIAGGGVDAPAAREKLRDVLTAQQSGTARSSVRSVSRDSYREPLHPRAL